MIRCNELRFNNYLIASVFPVKTEILDKLYEKYKKDLLLDIYDFSSKYKSKIRESGLRSRRDFEDYLNGEIEAEFRNKVELSNEFRILLIQDHDYAQYFNWFKRYYYLKFFERIKIENIKTKCLVEEDIENPNEYYIKIVITLPFEDNDYDLVLELMKIFINAQDNLLNYFIQRYNLQEEIFKCFKKTFFIFKSIEE